MFMLDIVWKVARHVTAWKLWQSGMTRSGFPISPPAPRGQRQRQAPSQAHTFANCRQSVPKARGWMPLTKRCEPQAQPAPLSLPSEWRFSWRSVGPAPSRSVRDGPPGTCCLFLRFSTSPCHPAPQHCIPLSSIPYTADYCVGIYLPVHTTFPSLICSVGEQTWISPTRGLVGCSG